MSTRYFTPKEELIVKVIKTKRENVYFGLRLKITPQMLKIMMEIQSIRPLLILDVQ